MSSLSSYLVIGAGVMGLSVARAILNKKPSASIVVVEKERQEAMHASGRNSGVLHAGFYYTADSLKAKFTKDGNAAWTKFCDERDLPINKCGKVVVARNESELEGIETLYARGIKNSVDVKIIDEIELADIEPNAKTYQKALYSPTTSTVDPALLCAKLRGELEKAGVEFIFGDGYAAKIEDGVRLKSAKTLKGVKIINCAGLYADNIAKDFGFGGDYTIIPFKGIYLKYSNSDAPIKTNIYPVPNLKNPFLGVHYTITVDSVIKIGPTAIPAFWRENYSGLDNFKFLEFVDIVSSEARLFLKNAFGFRSLALTEMQKYNKEYLASLAAELVKVVDNDGFRGWSKPGIRAQLLNTDTLELLQDFVVEGDGQSVHILNAVSPAFTAALPFGEWVVKNYLE